MKPVDAFLCFCILDLAGADIAVEHGIGEAEVFLIALAAKPVRGCFIDKACGEPECPALLRRR